ncbi:MAG TPA: ABC transporter substrate-binding protein [Lichenihabitans sp.]|jgi:peptide/nickel transport system substrate-binding protein|nr:ABC transporter substrate-binding protein [Lichenihabitans sp.]
MSEINGHVSKLAADLEAKKINRREFVRYAALMGMAAPAAYALAGKITGEPFAPSAAAATAPAALPKGGTWRIGTRIKDIKNPHAYSWGGYDSNVSRQVVEYLTFTDADGVTKPYLAESWEVSPDLKTWTFKLVKGVKWTKGDELTVDHVIWNLKHALDPAVGSSFIGLVHGYLLNDKTGADGKPTTELWSVNAIEKVDDHTFRFNCKNPQVAVPEHLFHYPMAILHPDDKGVFGVGAQGTGPFDLTEFELGKRAVLKRRTGYWGGDAAIDGMEQIDVGDDVTAPIAALASKQLDGLAIAYPSQYDALKAIDHLNFFQVKTAETGTIRMHVASKPFDDPKVRQAMRKAIDPQPVLEVALRGIGTIGEHTHCSVALPDFAAIDPPKRDVEGAKKLLAEAGHPDGIEVELVVPNDIDWFQPMAETCQQMWAEAGIKVNLKPIPGASYWDIWTKVPFSITIWYHRPLCTMLLGLGYRSGAAWNESGWSNKEFDDLLTQADGILDLDKRKAIVAKLEQIMLEDGPLVQPVFRNVFTFMDKRVVGFYAHPSNYFFGWKIGLEQA